MASRGRGGRSRGEGRGRGRGRGGRGSRGCYSGGGFLENTHHAFSLADEAKNTERHRGNYAGGSLRHSRISFVSAGHMEPSELLKPLNANVLPPEEGRQLTQAKAESSTDSAEDEGDVPMHFEETDSPAEPLTEVLQEEIDMQKLDLDPPKKTLVVDVIGDPSLNPKGQTHTSVPVCSQIRSPSPVRPGSASSSGSEKIVFIPRKMRPVLSHTNKLRTDSQIPCRIPSPKQVPPLQPTAEQKIAETVITETTTTTTNDTVPTVPSINHPSAPSSSTNVPFTRTTQGNKRRHKRNQRGKGSEDDEIIEDYIKNIAEDTESFAEGESSDPIGMTANRRDLGGDDSWCSATDSDDEAEDSDAVNAYKASMWEAHELDDLEGLSTSSEGPKGPIDTVLGKRKRPSGVQYLIKWSGYETDDATWVLAESLDSSADPMITGYEEILIQKATGAANAAGSTEDSEEDEDEDENEGEYSNDDEKLARFLQKQEAMGITKSDLELNLKLHELMDLDSSRKGKKKVKGKSYLPDIVPDRRTGFFPSASRFADAYDDFDPMEWERPSLTAVKKGRVKGKGKKGKGKLPFLGLSDSELEENLQKTFQKDREKKKARKAEREALRAEGLLGSKNGKRDAKAKWKEGINVEELKGEIMMFLLSENQSLALPPMNASDRKIAHIFASAFGLKSKSKGSKISRFTTLYKTSYSSPFEHDEDIIAAVMNRKHSFGSPDAQVGRRGRNEARGRGGGGGRGSGVVRHREGDIVGGSAPEIAEDNKGRRMLEKMGYRTGMALGVDGNKGIVVPVAAVVKISKAGLG